MSNNLPDDLLFSNDPEVQAALNDPEKYRELKEKHGIVEDPELDGDGTPAPSSGQTSTEPPQTPAKKADEPPTDPPPADPPESEPDSKDQDTPPEPAEPVLTEDDAKVLMRLKIIDDKGKFLSKYDNVDKMLDAIGHKDKALSSKFGDWVKKNPQLAKELLHDAGAIPDTPDPAPPADPPPADPTEGDGQEPEGADGQKPPEPAAAPSQQLPGDPTPEQRVDSILNSQYNIDALLEAEFKDDLAELGLDMPKDKKAWRELGDVSPGLYSEMWERSKGLVAQREETKTIMLNAANAIQQRRAQRPAYEQQLLAAERKELLDQGFSEDLITRAQEELLARRQDDYNVDFTYFDDADPLGNRVFVPILREGALKQFLQINHFDAVVKSVAEREVEERIGKRLDHQRQKEKRASIFPASIAGATGKGHSRTALLHPRPTPQEYWNQGWRDKNLPDSKTRDAVRDWIRTLPKAEQEPYRNNPG